MDDIRGNRVIRTKMMSGPKENDWAEDFPHENGDYCNQCIVCDSDFRGHKRRVICRKCHSRAQEKYEAMSPEEREQFDRDGEDEITKALEKWCWEPMRLKGTEKLNGRD